MPLPNDYRNKIKNPIFLLSTERSGSNLIRAMIGSHSMISAPPPPNLLHHFMPLRTLYGDLTNDANMSRLISDTKAYVRKKFSPWKLNDPVEEILNSVSSRSIMAVLDELYFREAGSKDSEYIFFKEIDMHKYAFHTLEFYKNPKYILLIRDGRDASLSASKSANHLYTAAGFAKRWAEEQMIFLRMYRMPMFNGKILIVHYEDLVSDPQESIKSICEFIGVEYEQSMIDFYLDEQFKKESGEVKNWRNIGRPILSKNFAKYRKAWSRAKTRKVESIMYRPLKLSGYPLENTVEKLSKINKADIRKGKIKGVLKKFLSGSFIDMGELKKRKDTVDFMLELENKLDGSMGSVTTPGVYEK